MVLWNRRYAPEDITPEYVRTLSIADCLKLLRWIDKYKEEEKGVIK